MSEDTLDKLTFVALGWLLGLLGPIIVDAIRRRKENSLGREALLSELREVGCLLATAAYGAHMHRGSLDRVFLDWLKFDLERHAVSEQFQVFIPNIRKQLARSDQDIVKDSASMVVSKGIGVVLQKYPVPLLDARVSALWTFDTSFQRGLLSVRQNIHMLDDLVERTRKYHDMTFATLGDDNRRRVVENIDQACGLYAERAVRTVTLIRELTANRT